MPRTVADVVRALPTPEEMYAARKGQPLPKGQSRLAARVATVRDEKAAERRWRTAIIHADGHRCRCCHTAVVAQLALAPRRLEVHHVAGRTDPALRWDVRNGLVLCQTCHGAVTRHERVLEQAALYQFRKGQQTYLNARKPVTFGVVA